MFKKVIGAVFALTATAVAVKVVSDILEAAESEQEIIDLDELSAKQQEVVMVETEKKEEQ